MLKALAKELTVISSYSALVPPLTGDEYADLKKSIAESGQYIPIIVNRDGIILDGHHRFRICQELSIKPKTMIKEFDNPLHEKLFVIDCNLQRRHLNQFQRIELALKSKPVLEAIAKTNMSLGGKGDKSLSALGRVNEQVGSRAKASYEQVRKVETIIQKASDEDREKLNKGQKTISKIYRKIQKAQKRNELMMMKPLMSLPKNVKLILGDFRDNAKEIRANTTDLLFTDPPYDKQSVPLYGELGKLAARVLKPGGSIVMYVGQYHLPQVIESIQSIKDLRYWWMFATKLNHYHGLVHRRQIYSSWKPLLWYVKGDRPKYSTDSISDFIQSPEPEKALYRYEQSVEEAEYIITHLTVENQIVFDPLMGSGTTGIAALQMKRKFIGIEYNPDVFKVAKARIRRYNGISYL